MADLTPLTPPNTNAWKNADRLTDGRLAELLVQWRREERLSFEDIVRRLWADHHVTVSIRTIGGWCRQLGTEDTAA